MAEATWLLNVPGEINHSLQKADTPFQYAHWTANFQESFSTPSFLLCDDVEADGLNIDRQNQTNQALNGQLHLGLNILPTAH
ncbi:MAG: hypothetical protein U5L96_12135 [Owenweeksia sp.]|nr:hypothetical protein [Owenweeksia sp.]